MSFDNGNEMARVAAEAVVVVECDNKTRKRKLSRGKHRIPEFLWKSSSGELSPGISIEGGKQRGIKECGGRWKSFYI